MPSRVNSACATQINTNQHLMMRGRVVHEFNHCTAWWQARRSVLSGAYQVLVYSWAPVPRAHALHSSLRVVSAMVDAVARAAVYTTYGHHARGSQSSPRSRQLPPMLKVPLAATTTHALAQQGCFAPVEQRTPIHGAAFKHARGTRTAHPLHAADLRQHGPLARLLALLLGHEHPWHTRVQGSRSNTSKESSTRGPPVAAAGRTRMRVRRDRLKCPHSDCVFAGTRTGCALYNTTGVGLQDRRGWSRFKNYGRLVKSYLSP